MGLITFFGLDLEAIGNADLLEEVMSLLQERKMARSNKNGSVQMKFVKNLTKLVI